MKSLFTLLCLIGIGFTQLSAQAPSRICGHDKVMEQMRLENPQFDTDYEAFIDNALNSDNLNRINDTVYKVQVVFHILYNENDPYQNVSDELIYSQLDALNRDYNMRNADTSETRAIFKDIAGNTKIEFELAKRRPNGDCANAIIRKPFVSPSPFLPIFLDFIVKENVLGSKAWNTKEYLNIWVLDLNRGGDPSSGFLGGYAYFPDMAPLQYNGVVIDFRFFGQDNPYIADVLPAFERYSKGRAGVHEVGHWLGLRHVWGDIGTLDPSLGCSADDGISDTPNAATAYASNGLCSDTIVNSCLDQPVDFPDMFENYMDYSSDDCQSMFTLEQVAVMREALLVYRPELIFEEVENTTETLTAVVFENSTEEVCFDLGDCFGFGDMEAHFVGADSNYTSMQGSAMLTGGNCISYSANNLVGGNEEDEFYIVVYDEHLLTYDTTKFTITIDQICPNIDTVFIDAAANSTFAHCLEKEPCLSDVNRILTFCNNAFVYETNDIIAGITDSCINFATDDYNPAQTVIEVCAIEQYSNDDKDTTIFVINVSPATGLDILNSEENSFDIYPNPTSGKFAIQKKGNINDHIQISIFNANGQQMKQTEMKSNENVLNMDISGFSKGIYILLFESDNSISFEKITLE